MNEASRWRYALAQKIAPLYRENPKVCLVEVGGSVSRGCADRYSDIELGIFWSTFPSETERSIVVKQLGGDLWHLHPYNPEERNWAEDYYVRGVKVDVGHWVREDTEHIISEVLGRYDITPWKQQFLSALQYALPLHGTPLLTQWQEQIRAYPDELARLMVQEHLWFSPQWGPEMLAERDDLLLLYEQMCSTEQKLLSVLVGLNHLYHPGSKWMDRLITEMCIAPPQLASRLKRVFQAESLAGVHQLQALVEEVFVLVEIHMPEIDVAKARAWFAHRRQTWDQAPDGLLT